MKQKTLFKSVTDKNSKYNKSVGSPIYEPKNKSPHVLELCNDSKSKRLRRSIEESKLGSDEKDFLFKASKRHDVFNYEKIADYYSNASKEMQELMEDSGLVIIDFEKAIELAYVNLSKEIKKQYLEQYED